MANFFVFLLPCRAVYPTTVELHSHSSPCSLADDTCLTRYWSHIHTKCLWFTLPVSPYAFVNLHVLLFCVCSQRAAVQTVQPSLAQHRDPWATTPNCSLGITAALSPLSPHPFFLIPLSFPKAAPNSRSLTHSLTNTQAHTLVTSCHVSSWWKKCVMPRLMTSIITGGDNEVDLNLVWWLSCFGLKTGEGRLGHMCPLVAWRAPHSYCSLPLVPTIWLLNNVELV